MGTIKLCEALAKFVQEYEERQTVLENIVTQSLEKIVEYVDRTDDEQKDLDKFVLVSDLKNLIHELEVMDVPDLHDVKNLIQQSLSR